MGISDAVEFTCLVCESTLTYCTICRICLFSIRNVQRHFSSYEHQTACRQVYQDQNCAQQANTTSTGVIQAPPTSFQRDPSKSSIWSLLMQSSQEPTPLQFANLFGTISPNDTSLNASAQYFKCEFSGIGQGAAQLVGNAVFGGGSTLATVHETHINLKLCRMLNRLGKDLGGELAELIEEIRRSDSLSPTNLRIPRTNAEVRNMYLEGSSSLMQNMPIPDVVSLRGGISYSSPVSIVKHVVAMDRLCELDVLWLDRCKGIYPDIPPSHSKPCETPRAAQIFNRYWSVRSGCPSLVLHFYYWEDDADMNTTRKDRQSTRIITLTVAGSNIRRHSSSGTYIIALGPKGADYTDVYTRCVDELNQLSSGIPIVMYHGGLRRLVNVYGEVNACLLDRVARGGLSFQSQGNGRYSAVWGYALDLKQLVKKLPLCKRCEARAVAISDGLSINVESCPDCVGWNYDSTSSVNSYPPPCDYPLEKVPADGLLRPKLVSSEMILDITMETYENVKDKTWSQKSAKAYLWAHGFESRYRDELVAAASENRPYFISPFVKLNGTDVRCHIDTVMHHVFLGVTKYIWRRLVQVLLLRRGSASKFHSLVAAPTKVIEDWGLEWMKLYGWNDGKFGGWFAENYLAIARISFWFGGPIADLLEIEPDIEPTGPPCMWSGETCKRWLISRNLNTSPSTKEWLASKGLDGKMNASRYKQRVREIIEGPGETPGPKTRVRVSPQSTVEVLRLLTATTGALMVQEVTPDQCKIASALSALLLNRFNDWDIMYRREKAGDWEFEDQLSGEGIDIDGHEDEDSEAVHRQSVVDCTNFASLPNLAKHVMPIYGNLRYMWEGDSKGEGIVRDIRPYFSGFRKNWAVNLHRRVMQQKAIAQVEEQSCLASGREYAPPKARKMHHTYKSVADIQDAIANCLPLSAIVISPGHIAIAFSVVEAIAVSLDGQSCLNVAGAQYFKISLNQTDATLKIDEENVMERCVMLPSLNVEGRFSGESPEYAVCTSDWKVLCTSSHPNENTVQLSFKGMN